MIRPWLERSISFKVIVIPFLGLLGRFISLFNRFGPSLVPEFDFVLIFVRFRFTFVLVKFWFPRKFVFTFQAF